MAKFFEVEDVEKAAALNPDSPSNISLMKVGLVLDRDPTLLEPLKGRAGDAFEREGPGTPWQKVTGWNPDGD